MFGNEKPKDQSLFNLHYFLSVYMDCDKDKKMEMMLFASGKIYRETGTCIYTNYLFSSNHKIH